MKYLYFLCQEIARDTIKYRAYSSRESALIEAKKLLTIPHINSLLLITAESVETIRPKVTELDIYNTD